MAPELTFRPLEHADLQQWDAWLRADHIRRWWGRAAGLSASYLGDDRPVRHFIALEDDRPIGMVQYYYWHDFPSGAGEVRASAGEIGIDYLIGDPSKIGTGRGPRMIGAFLQASTHGRGDVAGVRVQVDAANRRSWRALEKLGFRRELDDIQLEGESGPSRVYVLDGGLDGKFEPAEIDAIVQHLWSNTAPKAMRQRIVAVDGLGGAGKSTLAVLLARRLRAAPIIHTDDFASADNTVNWYPRMLEQVLVPLSEGRSARYQRYDWNREQMAEWHELNPSEFIVLEGVTASRQAFRPYLTTSVWVHTVREERLRRGLERDGQQALPLWEQWMREEDRYIAREHPERVADIVISGQSGLAAT